MPKKKIDMFDLKLRFNDIVLREFGLGVTDDDYVFDYDSDTILQIKEKYIKYSEDEYPVTKADEIDLNLIENPRLTETLVLPYMHRACARRGSQFQSLAQVPIDGTNKGIFVLYYEKDGQTKSIASDPYVNESVRIFNLVTILNKTSHMYNFNEFDVEIVRKK